jgi:hypothetical protein
VRKIPSQRGFPWKIGRVAQLAEHSALNRQVVGSIPTASTKFPFEFSAFPLGRGPSLRSGFRLRAQTPAKRLKFDSYRVHHFEANHQAIFPLSLPPRMKLDTRLEAFNVPNHPNFANPSVSNPAGSTFGDITSTAGGTSLANIPALAARVFQGSVKITF